MMGQRVAKMVEPCGDHDKVGWCVYQSTAMACFNPIFHWELSAWIFARHLEVIYPDWDDSALEHLQGDVDAFVRLKFSDDPEESDAYYDTLAAEQNDQTDFYVEFLDWWRARKAQAAKGGQR